MADPQTNPPEKLKIRKYPNRRYYDTARSRHVTLEQIHSLIREGCEIEVVDYKTGADITAKVLAQIILDLDPPKLGVFSIPMLHRLLQSNEKMVGEFIDRYLNQPLTAFLDSQRGMQEYFRQAMGMKTPTGGPTDWAHAIWGPFNPAFWGGKSRNGSNPRGEASASEAGLAGAEVAGNPRDQGAEQGSTAELLAQIAALRQQVSELRENQERPTAKKVRKQTRKAK